MGHVRVAIKLANPETRDGAVEVKEALVDTGATWTTVPRDIAKQLDLRLVGQMTVRTAAGPQTLDRSYAKIDLGQKTMVTPVLVSDTYPGVLIGVITLEGLGLAVDPTSGRLVDSELPLLVSLA